MSANPYRHLPAVNDVLDAPPIRALCDNRGRELTVAAIHDELDDLRQRIRRGQALDGAISLDAVVTHVIQRLGRELRPKLRPVINATGIVLHTNLGRAPIAEEAAK